MTWNHIGCRGGSSAPHDPASPASPRAAIQARIAASSSRQRASIASTVGSSSTVSSAMASSNSVGWSAVEAFAPRPLDVELVDERRVQVCGWSAPSVVGERRRGGAGRGEHPVPDEVEVVEQRLHVVLSHDEASIAGAAAPRLGGRSFRRPGSPRVSTKFWHGFADMHLVKDAEVVIRSAEGVWLETTDGRRCSIRPRRCGTAQSGYGRRAIADAVAEQLARSRPTRRSGRTRPRPPSPWPTACRRWRRSTTRSSSSAPAARTGRHGGQARPPLLGRRGPPGEADPRVARARLPRDARVGHVAGRHPGQQGGLRRRVHR